MELQNDQLDVPRTVVMIWVAAQDLTISYICVYLDDVSLFCGSFDHNCIFCTCLNQESTIRTRFGSDSIICA